jgi:hypothetical protein
MRLKLHNVLLDAETASFYRLKAQDQLGYTATQSLLFSGTATGANALRARAASLAAAGTTAEYLPSSACTAAEPLLAMPDEGGALRVRTDIQIDARAASEYLLQQCTELGGGVGRRFSARFGVQVLQLRMGCCSGAISGVRTSAGDFLCSYASAPPPSCKSQAVSDVVMSSASRDLCPTSYQTRPVTYLTATSGQMPLNDVISIPPSPMHGLTAT